MQKLYYVWVRFDILLPRWNNTYIMNFFIRSSDWSRINLSCDLNIDFSIKETHKNVVMNDYH